MCDLGSKIEGWIILDCGLENRASSWRTGITPIVHKGWPEQTSKSAVIINRSFKDDHSTLFVQGDVSREQAWS